MFDTDINEQHIYTQGFNCKYHLPCEFRHSLSDCNQSSDLSLLHLNVRSLVKNHDNLTQFLSTLQYDFPIIGITETWLNENSPDLIKIDGYKLIRADTFKVAALWCEGRCSQLVFQLSI